MKLVWRDGVGGVSTIPGAVTSLDPLHRRVRMRNIREYVAATAATSVFALYCFAFDELLLKLGSLAMIAGIAIMAWNLHRRASSSRRMDATDIAQPCLPFLKAELMRQRDALRSVWKWYLLPLVPGVILFLVGTAQTLPGGVPIALAIGVGQALLAAVVIRLNHNAAAQIESELQTLE